ncbi:hypothetical protein EDB83DRAFT_441962 [Lactarius deliciosus]|nr:hypothetical protein EDB83DRAFT_441962 [Lactarius deliciosus]
MTAISVTGPGDEPAPVPHENDDPARKARTTTSRCAIATWRCVRTFFPFYARTYPVRQSQHSPTPAGASRRSTSLQSRVPSRRMSKTPLFFPSPSESTSSEPPTRQRDRDRDNDPLDIISIDVSSSSSQRRPPRRSPCKTKKRRGQGKLMAYVLVPSRTARASQTICRLSNGPAHASTRQQPRGQRGQGTIRTRARFQLAGS